MEGKKYFLRSKYVIQLSKNIIRNPHVWRFNYDLCEDYKISQIHLKKKTSQKLFDSSMIFLKIMRLNSSSFKW